MESLISEVRDQYVDLVQNEIPFVSVCKDTWDLWQEKIPGISLCFYNPVQRGVFRIPIGVDSVSDTSSGKGSQKTLKAFDFLRVVGLKECDLLKPVFFHRPSWNLRYEQGNLVPTPNPPGNPVCLG